MKYSLQNLLLSFLCFVAFFVFFGAVFSPFYFAHALPGTTDALGQLAIFYDHYHHFLNTFYDAGIGFPLYPWDGVSQFTESYHGQTLLFFSFKKLGFDDIISSLLMIQSLFALNALAVCKLVRHYTHDRLAGLLGGLIFSGSCFMYSNLELLNTLGFFPLAFSIYFMEKFLSTKKQVSLMLSLCFLSLTHFFSGYIFLFTIVIWILIFLLKWKKFIRLKPETLAFSAIISAVLTTPFVLKLSFFARPDVVNPLTEIENFQTYFSLDLSSLFQSLPNNLIYSDNISLGIGQAVKIPYSVNIGIGVLFLVFLSIFFRFKRKWFYMLILVLSLLFSFGPEVVIKNKIISLPLKTLNQIDFFQSLFRIPGRSFVITQFAIAILSSITVHHLLQNKYRFLTVFVLGLVVVVENTPLPFQINPIQPNLNSPPIYTSPHLDKNKVIAILPSSLFTQTGYVEGYSEFSREYHYLYWQVNHKISIINGSASYFPQTRLDNNELLKNISSSHHLDSLITNNGVDYIIFHEFFALFPWEKDQLAFLLNHSAIEFVEENDRSWLFKTNR